MSVKNIDRFEILSELGQSADGVVYLANEPHLDRRVVIKTQRALQDAGKVSRLQHPNIVALYDTGEYQGQPYLVYAHVEGQTLDELEKPLSLVRAVEIACAVLEALIYAHELGVLHLNVEPANVMIGNVPMLMNFGVQPDCASVPELLAGMPADERTDIYCVGRLLYQMVTGAMPDDRRIPSAINVRVDENLDAIILKALANNPDERYASALAMKEALQDYLGEKYPDSVQKGTHGTLDFLLRRMRSKSDFPALTNIISEINQIVSSESESSNKLARTILQDFALTSRLLKLVNTASFGQFGGTINTVSKAVVILGFDTVRNIAMSLILMDFLQNKAQAVQLKDEVVQAIFTGIVAAQLSVGHNIRDAEEVMVCAMFHNLGRMLVTYYFFDESQGVSRLVEQGETESQAAIKVLGITYTELGLAVARSWNFPPRLLAGMRKLPVGKVGPAVGDLDYLTVTINLADDLCTLAASCDEKNKHKSLAELIKRYESATRISERELSGAIDVGLTELGHRSAIINLSTGKSPLLSRVRKWSGHAAEPEKSGFDQITNLDQTVSQDSAKPQNPEAILGAGIQDVTASLVGDVNLNDVLQMVLETMYRGVGFNRALIMIRDNRQNAMMARFGFGAGIEALIPKFHFPLPFVPDVFHLSIQKGLDIAIENIDAPNIADKIPDWYRKSINAPCFILLPVMLKDRAIGMFYADMLIADSLKMSEHQLSLLRTLRNQAVLAIKTKT